MAFKVLLLASVVVSVVTAQRGSRIDPEQFSFNILNERATTTPVPILRFIDRQNGDGSYTYGYENGDGTYKIETRYATGEVKGKYGYLDTDGQLREVEYGASPGRGFEPRADGLVVAPPTLVDETAIEEPTQFLDESVEDQPETANQFANFRPRNNNDNRRVVIRKKDRRNQLPIRARPAPRPKSRPAPRPAFTAPQQPVAPAFVPANNPHRFDGHPASNINLQTGSYTVTYG